MAVSVVARAQATPSSPAAPFDEINGASLTQSTTLNGGGGSTSSLVDSNGEKAWSISGYYQIALAGGSVPVRSTASPTPQETVVTILRFKTKVQSTTAFEIGAGGTVDSLASPNRHVLRYSASDSLTASPNGVNNGLGAAPTTADTEQTFVIRSINAGSDSVDVWWSNGGGTSTPDDSATPTMSNSNIDYFIFGCPTADTIEFFDAIVLAGESITDQECRDIANDVRSVYPTATPVTVNGALGTATATGSIADVNIGTGEVVNASLGTVTVSGNAAQVFTSQPVVVDGALGSVSAAGLAATVDNNYWGPTRAEIEASDQTSGVALPFLVNDFEVGDAQDDRFRYTQDTSPSAGTLTLDEFSRGTFDGAPAGQYTFNYTGYKNNVSYGSATVTLNVISPVVVNASLGTVAASGLQASVTIPGSTVSINASLGQVSVTGYSASISLTAPKVTSEFVGILPEIAFTGTIN